MNKRRALGRGLEALIPSGEYVEELDGDVRTRRRFAMQVPIAEIHPNPEQPRRVMDPASLQELADSIHIHGILQPLLVREGLDGFELIAGERRLRAAEIAGLSEVPVIVHPTSGGRLEERLELALVENLQRTDLNPIEQARAVRRLLQDFGLTHEALAERLGKNPVSIGQNLRLLGLPEDGIKAIEAGAITAGHGVALLALPSAAEQLACMQRVIDGHWSVRQTENWVRTRKTEIGFVHGRHAVMTDPDTRALEDEFRRALGTKVVLTRLKHGGRLTIEFYSDEELEGLRRRLI